MNTVEIGPVARRLLGEPNRALSTKTELRYGRNGSLVVNVKKDVWYDFQALSWA